MRVLHTTTTRLRQLQRTQGSMLARQLHWRSAVFGVLLALVSGLQPVVFADEADGRSEQDIEAPAVTDQAAENARRSVDAVEYADPLDRLVDTAIEINFQRNLDVAVHSPWQVLHGLLALRGDFEVVQNGRRINGLEWLASNPTYRGEPLFEKTQYGGRAHPFSEPYIFQGHQNQFLAILTMSRLPSDFQLLTNDGPMTIGDVVRNSQIEFDYRHEVTWSLWALSHYLPWDAQWTNEAGQPCSIEQMIEIELRNDPTMAACGGTHGLYALAYARNAYLHAGQQLRGVWLEADQKVRRYSAVAQSLQNRDGSFSTQHFRGPGYSNEFAKRIETSGHILEFLMMALPASELKKEWVRRGVESLANDLIRNRNVTARCGALYHSVHALILYRERTSDDDLPIAAGNLLPEPVPTGAMATPQMELQADRENARKLQEEQTADSRNDDKSQKGLFRRRSRRASR